MSTTMTPQYGALGISLFTVQTASGSALNLMTQEEADWYEGRRDEYLTHNKFPNVADMLDLDRLLLLEVMIYRWGMWLAQGWDYLHGMVDPRELQKNIKDYSAEIRALKLAMGLDKVSRERAKGENVGDYIAMLLERAKQFGYMRNEQYEFVVTKLWELRSMILLHDRCDATERKELDLSPESILGWVREDVLPEWDAIDASFRKQQSVWIRQL